MKKLLCGLYISICVAVFSLTYDVAAENVRDKELEKISIEIQEAYTTDNFYGNITARKFFVARIKLINKDSRQHAFSREDFSLKTIDRRTFYPAFPYTANCLRMTELVGAGQAIERLLVFEVDKHYNRFVLFVTPSDLLTSNYLYFEFKFD